MTVSYKDETDLKGFSVTLDETLTTKKCDGTLFDNFGQDATSTITITVCAAAKGLRTSFAGTSVNDACQVYLKPATGEVFYLNGTALDANDRILCNDPDVSDTISGVCRQTGSGTYSWFWEVVRGTSFSDGGQ